MTTPTFPTPEVLAREAAAPDPDADGLVPVPDDVEQPDQAPTADTGREG